MKKANELKEPNEMQPEKQLTTVVMTVLNVEEAIDKLDAQVKRAYAMGLSIEDNLMMILSLSKRLGDIVEYILDVEENIQEEKS